MDDYRHHNELRRIAARKGMQLRKYRRRNPQAPGFGLFYLVSNRDETVVADSMTLDEVIRYLTRPGG